MALWPRSSLFVRPDLAAACSHDHPSRFHQDGDDLAAGVPLLCPSPGSCTGASPRVKPGRPHFERPEIGRASCRESVCQYVSISVVAVDLKKKTFYNIKSNNT